MIRIETEVREREKIETRLRESERIETGVREGIGTGVRIGPLLPFPGCT